MRKTEQKCSNNTSTPKNHHMRTASGNMACTRPMCCPLSPCSVISAQRITHSELISHCQLLSGFCMESTRWQDPRHVSDTSKPTRALQPPPPPSSSGVQVRECGAANELPRKRQLLALVVAAVLWHRDLLHPSHRLGDLVQGASARAREAGFGGVWRGGGGRGGSQHGSHGSAGSRGARALHSTT